MEMIETKKYSQNPKTYFSIILNTSLKKKKLLYLLVFIIGCVHLLIYVKYNRTASLVWASLAFGYFVFIYIYLYRFAHSKDKKDFLGEKQLFFNNENVRIEEGVGDFGEFPYSRILRVVDEKGFWMLYISKSQFIYVPKDIFYEKEHFEKFQEYILA